MGDRKLSRGQKVSGLFTDLVGWFGNLNRHRRAAEHAEDAQRV